MKKPRPAPDDENCGTHAFADTSERWPIDQLLRARGFRILERRGQQEPFWQDSTGLPLLQSLALEWIGYYDDGGVPRPLVRLHHPHFESPACEGK